MAIKRLTLEQKIIENIDSSLSRGCCSAMEGRRIIGIDPGTNVLGYAVVEVEGGELRVLVFGVLSLAKYSDHYKKLSRIFSRLSSVVEAYHPDEMALEAPFFGKNVQSMLKLGRAQGVAMSVALSRGIDVFEYAPTRVKQSVAGQGGASKEQVAGILSHLFGVDTSDSQFDATDALAVAVCHYFTQSRKILL
ncbi:MAG: crossover junction endodeoxyribonuclease RuvC [Rikenellaceae bacterium]